MLMQKGTFRFGAAVHDDAPRGNTQSISNFQKCAYQILN